MLSIYKASAGSGKTFQLTREYIHLLFKHNSSAYPHRKILAVTFTNKATAEMKSRIISQLNDLATNSKSPYSQELKKIYGDKVVEIAKSLLERILNDYSAFSVSTIDKFFLKIIRSFTRELGISGNYNVHIDTDDILSQSVDNLFLNLSTENKQLMKWLERFYEDSIRDGGGWKINNKLIKLGDQLFKEGYQAKRDVNSDGFLDKKNLELFQKKQIKTIRKFEIEVDKKVDTIFNFIKNNSITNDMFVRGQLAIQLNKYKRLRDFNMTTTFSKFLVKAENCYTKQNAKKLSPIIDPIYPNLQKLLIDIVDFINSDIDSYNTASIINSNIFTLGILSDLMVEINKIGSENNLMLLSNLNLLLNKIIDNSDTPFVYERTGIFTNNYMIDEFQDTSTLQWKNFKPLIENSLSQNDDNLLVGDVKQSIYRWRNSDWQLMASQVEKDFDDYQTEGITLNKNWRSNENIVEFNNLFFKHSPTTLKEKLDSELMDSVELSHLSTKITNAYSDVVQEPKKTSTKGYVKFEFLPHETQTNWNELVLEKIPELIENLHDRGYRGADIAFLVRNRKDAKLIMDCLINYKNSDKSRADVSYAVMGSEGLKTSDSQSVKFIVSLLKNIINPNDKIHQFNILYQYLLGKKKMSESEAITTAASSTPQEIFTTAELQCLEQMRIHSIFESIEIIISRFDLANWYNDIASIVAFQDLVLKHSTTQYSDLYSFVKWWDERKNKQYLALSESQHAIKVMTIHKSKGLDFNVVILPFFNWNLDADANKNMLWFRTEKEEEIDASVLPIMYSEKLKNSHFKNQYFEEKMLQYVDNLNLAYVALTRARNEIYGWCKEKISKSKNTIENNITNIGELLINTVKSNEDLSKHLNSDGIFQMGTPTICSTQKDIKNTNNSIIDTYPINRNKRELSMRHISTDSLYFDSNSNKNRSYYGVLMHELLSKINNKDEQSKFLQQYILTGKIDVQEREEIEKELENFWNLPHVKDWFGEDIEHLTEQNVFFEGKIYRPDRVVIKNNIATIVDYKFGEEEPSHQKQISNYKTIFEAMNYKVVAYLCYVSHKKVIKID